MERRSGSPLGVKLWLRCVDAHGLWQPWRSGSVPLPFWSTTTGEPDPFKTLNQSAKAAETVTMTTPPPPHPSPIQRFVTESPSNTWLRCLRGFYKFSWVRSLKNVGLAAPAPVLWERQHFCPPRDNEMFHIWPRGRQIFRTQPTRTKQSLNLWPSTNISFAVFSENAGTSQHLKGSPGGKNSGCTGLNSAEGSPLTRFIFTRPSCEAHFSTQMLDFIS